MIRPTRGKLLAEILPEETKIGNIFVARTKKEIPTRAKILAVGVPEVGKRGKEIKPCAESGQVVYIKRYSGARIDMDGKKLIILRNEDIVGVV